MVFQVSAGKEQGEKEDESGVEVVREASEKLAVSWDYVSVLIRLALYFGGILSGMKA